MQLTSINDCLMLFSDRAERMDSEHLVSTFVNVGPLATSLLSKNNQIIYGRRGTGKTHALRYFERSRQKSHTSDLAVYVDCTRLGSNQSIYDDRSLPFTERATRLVLDVLGSVYASLRVEFVKRGKLAEAGESMNALTDALTEVRIVGPIEVETLESVGHEKLTGNDINVEISKNPSFSLGTKESLSESGSNQQRQRVQGEVRHSLSFGSLARALENVVKFISPGRLWVLIDEWSTVPDDLQPYLGDLLRRVFFTITNVSVKIAAIEHRSKFKIDLLSNQYIGLELGADITSIVNLDDYLVFDNNKDRSESFFRALIFKHVRAIAKEYGIVIPGDEMNFIGDAFTQTNVFTEFVKATEGVPRDGMHILSLAAQYAHVDAISIPMLRKAALSFFQSEKYQSIQSSPENREMLDWIRDVVIRKRRTRAFMLPVETADPIIDRLFDRRAIHILDKSKSAAHRPGNRFVVYKLDYGCYVDQINTKFSPNGLLFSGKEGIDDDLDVPDDDARSYRRAVLDLSEFYAQHRHLDPDGKVQ